MKIAHLTPTFADIKTWVRSATTSVNQLITGKQDKSDNLTSLSGLDLTGNSGEVIAVKATEDGFELVAQAGGGSGIADGDYGDIVVSGSGTVLDIDAGAVGTTELANDAVTYAKIQNVSATDKLLGRSTAGSGVVEEIACTAAGRALLDDATASDQRTTLGLGSIATQAASGVTITGGSVTGIADLALADGGTGASLSDPNADRIMFWDDSAGAVTWLAPSTGLSISGTNLTATGVWRLLGGAYASAGTWDQAVDGSVANIDFTGLAGATDIRVVMHGVTKSVSNVSFLTVSVNNGSSWFTTSGDYVFIDTAGVVTNAATMGQFHLTSTTAARTGIVEIQNANVAPAVGINVNVAVSHRLFLGSTSAINAVRVTPGGGGNFTGGKVYCFVR